VRRPLVKVGRNFIDDRVSSQDYSFPRGSTNPSTLCWRPR